MRAAGPTPPLSLLLTLLLGLLPGLLAFAASPSALAAQTGPSLSRSVIPPRPPARPISGRDVDLEALRTIHIAKDASPEERTAAKALQTAIEQRYGWTTRVREGLPVADAPVVLLGRSLALASGLVKAEELDAVKRDGYVLKAAGDRIVIAGFAPPGTAYGTFELLRRLGWRSYPAAIGGNVEGWSGEPVVRMPAFAVSARPHFDRRDGYADDGRFGATMRPYVLGELKTQYQNDPLVRDRGWLNWDHTSGYLLPLARYRDTHPEYYASRNGETLPMSTPNGGVALCPCFPDVVRITAERLSEWMQSDPNRWLFGVTDGDTQSWDCPQCAAGAPRPDYPTDRLLDWVNGVARDAARRDPDKRIFTLAYLQYVKPPEGDHLEPNAYVMYAPWLWSSRSTGAVSFAHPVNTTAMEELLAWTRKFPGQMGVYDYANDWIWSVAERIKFFAKIGVRLIYQNQSTIGLQQWLATRLMWDPLLDAERLQAEYVAANFGPAAAPMAEFLDLKRRLIEHGSMVSVDFYRDPALLAKVRDTLDRLEASLKRANPPTQLAILTGMLDAVSVLLQGNPPGPTDPSLRRRDLDRLLSVTKQALDTARAQGVPEHAIRGWLGEAEKAAHRAGVDLPRTPPKSASIDDRVLAMTLAIAAAKDAVSSGASEGRRRQADAGTVGQSFAGEREARLWSMGGSAPDLVRMPEPATNEAPTGEKRKGVRFLLPMNQLPVVERGAKAVHGGRFFAERNFDPPIDIGGRRYIDLHLYASHAIPITLYVTVDKPLKTSVTLVPGEQIVRIDLDQFEDAGGPSARLRRLAIDFWPQDIFYPYPPATDTEVVLFGIEATGAKPAVAALPHRGRAIWMTHFRPNLGLDNDAIVEVAERVVEKGPRARDALAVDLEYRRGDRETFRSYTEDRIVSPLFAILTGPQATPQDREAATALQARLASLHGVTLPIDPGGATAGADSRNAIIVGRSGALAAGAIGEDELAFAGPEGFVVRAKDGRIALAGNGPDGTLYAVARYLEDHGARFAIPEVTEYLPDRRDAFLHELFLIDWPFFASRPVPCGSLLTSEGQAKSWDVAAPAGARETERAHALGDAIKDQVRDGATALPAALLDEAARSPLNCYVAAKLVWDPFADTTRLVREFREAAG